MPTQPALTLILATLVLASPAHAISRSQAPARLKEAISASSKVLRGAHVDRTIHLGKPRTRRSVIHPFTFTDSGSMPIPTGGYKGYEAVVEPMMSVMGSGEGVFNMRTGKATISSFQATVLVFQNRARNDVLHSFSFINGYWGNSWITPFNLFPRVSM